MESNFRRPTPSVRCCPRNVTPCLISTQDEHFARRAEVVGLSKFIHRAPQDQIGRRDASRNVFGQRGEGRVRALVEKVPPQRARVVAVQRPRQLVLERQMYQREAVGGREARRPDVLVVGARVLARQEALLRDRAEDAVLRKDTTRAEATRRLQGVAFESCASGVESSTAGMVA